VRRNLKRFPEDFMLQLSFRQYKMSAEGTIINSVPTYRINRRIVGYTDPSSVNSLSYYANEVIEKGLEYNQE
jgi:hypothetical protein